MEAFCQINIVLFHKLYLFYKHLLTRKHFDMCFKAFHLTNCLHLGMGRYFCGHICRDLSIFVHWRTQRLDGGRYSNPEINGRKSEILEI